MFQKVSTTRTELIARKKQLELAAQGRNLLDQKRGVLLKEFLKVVDTVLEQSEKLEKRAAVARRALVRAESTVGPEELRSISFASRDELSIKIESVNLMGVKVPNIEQRTVSRSVSGRGYSFVGTSVTIDEAAAAFELQVEMILQLAESELRLSRLAQEIQQTTRRLNALDHILIPGLEAERDLIQMALDERERADHFRLKLVKRSLERKRSTMDDQ
jgi:V/A-type H+-transporting ATPase subunit D